MGELRRARGRRGVVVEGGGDLYLVITEGWRSTWLISFFSFFLQKNHPEISPLRKFGHMPSLAHGLHGTYMAACKTDLGPAERPGHHLLLPRKRL